MAGRFHPLPVFDAGGYTGGEHIAGHGGHHGAYLCVPQGMLKGYRKRKCDENVIIL